MVDADVGHIFDLPFHMYKQLLIDMVTLYREQDRYQALQRTLRRQHVNTCMNTYMNTYLDTCIRTNKTIKWI